MLRGQLKRFHKALWRVFITFCIPVRHAFGTIRTFRRFAFDSSRVNSFIAVTCRDEHFVVSANDSTIARQVYVKRDPFDFDKFEATLKLLPESHTRDTLLDIGANIGTISVTAIKRNHFRSAIAVEPDPLNYTLLTTNVHLNQVSEHFVCHNAAVASSSESSVSFGLSEINHGDHRIVWNSTDKNEEIRELIEVDVITMNDITDNLKATTAFVWMDIQGHEGHALSTASTLKNTGIPMCLEFWPFGLKNSGGYQLLKDALTDGKWNVLIDLDSPSERLALNSEALDHIFEKVGLEGMNTDILVLCE